MSRVEIKPKNDKQSIFMGIECGMWFFQIFDGEGECIRDKDYNRSGLMEDMTKYCDLEDARTKHVLACVTMDVDPGNVTLVA